MKKIIQSFDFESGLELLHSVMPSAKYKMLSIVVLLNFFLTGVERVFGINAPAFIALLVVMAFELASGLYAAHIKGESYSSVKLSRFTFKCAIYLVLILVPYQFHKSYDAHGNDIASSLFEWMHIFFVVQIVAENIISILENLAVIQGKGKTYWIQKIKEKISSI